MSAAHISRSAPAPHNASTLPETPDNAVAENEACSLEQNVAQDNGSAMSGERRLEELNHTEAEPAEIEMSVLDQSAALPTPHPDTHRTDGRGTLLRSSFMQLRPTIAAFLLLLPMSALLFYYVFKTLVAADPHLGLLVFSPSNTLITITVLSQAWILLVAFLIGEAFAAFRWQLASMTKGVEATSFLAMSAKAPLWGVFMLMLTLGSHIYWCIQGIVVLLSCWFVNFVLTVHIEYPTVYTPTQSWPVFAGMTPLNITSLQQGLVRPKVLCVFFTGWLANILSVSKYVTSIAPVSCTSDCVSYYLPGGVDQARLLTPGVNSTLLEGGLFDDAGAIIVNSAPGYQLDFSAPPPGFAFNETQDCKMNGQARGEGLYICVGSKNSTIVAGWSACPSDQLNSGQCFDNISWAFPPKYTTALNIWERYATVTYDRQNLSILSVESITAPEPIAYPPLYFREIFKYLLTSNATNDADDEVMVNSMVIELGWLIRLYEDLFHDDKVSPLTYLRGMLTVPIQFSAAAWELGNASLPGTGLFPLPDNLQTTASAATVSQCITASPWTVYTFIAVGSCLLLWLAFLIGWVLWHGNTTTPPNTSSFPEVDLAARATTTTTRSPGPLSSTALTPATMQYTSAEEEEDQQHAQAADHPPPLAPGTFVDLATLLQQASLSNASTSAIVRAMKGKRLRVGAVASGSRSGPGPGPGPEGANQGQRSIVIGSVVEGSANARASDGRRERVVVLAPGVNTKGGESSNSSGSSSVEMKEEADGEASSGGGGIIVPGRDEEELERLVPGRKYW